MQYVYRSHLCQNYRANYRNLLRQGEFQGWVLEPALATKNKVYDELGHSLILSLIAIHGYIKWACIGSISGEIFNDLNEFQVQVSGMKSEHLAFKRILLNNGPTNFLWQHDNNFCMY